MKEDWCKKIEGKWAYVLTRTLRFWVPELRLGELEIYSLKGELLATAKKGWLLIHAGYTWDGCTCIGRIMETEGTLKASAFHDLGYQLAEQEPFYTVPYTQRMIDKAFRRFLPLWAKPIYYLGVRAFGWAFYGDAEKSLDIKILEQKKEQ